MRIAITASGDSPNSPVDGRFTAAHYMLIFDTENRLWESVKFSIWSRSHRRSGHIRAGLMREKGVVALISGGVDPRSFRELGKRGIRVYQAPDSSVGEAADMLAAGHLAVLHIPDAVDVTKLVRKA